MLPCTLFVPFGAKIATLASQSYGISIGAQLCLLFDQVGKLLAVLPHMNEGNKLDCDISNSFTILGA